MLIFLVQMDRGQTFAWIGQARLLDRQGMLLQDGRHFPLDPVQHEPADKLLRLDHPDRADARELHLLAWVQEDLQALRFLHVNLLQ